MSMNRLTKQTLVFVFGFLLFLLAIGLVGGAERTEQIVYTMPQEAYEQICIELGNKCTDREIADRYLSNKKYYDSLY